jgi:SAF domain
MAVSTSVRPAMSANGSRAVQEDRAPRGRSRRRPWVAALMVLVPLAVVLGVVTVQRLGDRISVLTAVRTIEPGQVLTPSDLQVVEVAIDGPAQVVSARDRDALVGLTASERIPAGSLVSPADFQAGVGLPAGTVVVGAVLQPGEVPTGELRTGDRVVLVSTAGQGAVAGVGSDEATELGEATVFSVAGSRSDGGGGGAQVSSTSLFVSLAVPRETSRRVAQASAGQRLRLVYLPPVGGGQR